MHYVHSAEFKATYGDSNTVGNQQFITLLYANVLDAAATALASPQAKGPRSSRDIVA